MMKRDELLQLDDAALSAHCKLEFYKDSGPGGQKRNKSSSAVRVTLTGSDLTASDCTERSQTRNRANALHKLRIQLALTCRETPAVPPENMTCSMNNTSYPLFLAHLLDVFYEKELDHRAAAETLGISATAFVKKLFRDPAVWQKINQELAAQGMFPLRAPK